MARATRHLLTTAPAGCTHAMTALPPRPAAPGVDAAAPPSAPRVVHRRPALAGRLPVRVRPPSRRGARCHHRAVRSAVPSRALCASAWSAGVGAARAVADAEETLWRAPRIAPDSVSAL
ncbi:hypothetical protein FGB62_461g05 [Gracilaria domingensis]|nr:hypothetical protein FGB62_461g05 [Gracilaria domingensis]